MILCLFCSTTRTSNVPLKGYEWGNLYLNDLSVSASLPASLLPLPFSHPTLSPWIPPKNPHSRRGGYPFLNLPLPTPASSTHSTTKLHSSHSNNLVEVNVKLYLDLWQYLNILVLLFWNEMLSFLKMFMNHHIMLNVNKTIVK